jgi:hypothetical protein
MGDALANGEGSGVELAPTPPDPSRGMRSVPITAMTNTASAATAMRSGVLMGSNLHGTGRAGRRRDAIGSRRGSLARSRRAGPPGPPPATRERSSQGRGQRSCRSNLPLVRFEIGVERRPKAACGVVEPGLHGSHGDAHDLTDRGQRKPDMVMQDHHRAMLRREPTERPLEGIAIVDGDHRIDTAQPTVRQGADVHRPASVAVRLL